MASRTTEAARAVDLLVSAALSSDDCSFNDPLAAVEFLRACWLPLALDVSCVRDSHAASTGSERQQRFDSLIQTLRSDVPRFSQAQALELCQYADRLRARRDPFVRPRFAADVGLHGGFSSSYAKQGRLLAALVRFMQPRGVIEIGTAYGMSAMFLAAELPDGGSIVSIEASHPQIDVARELLAGTGQPIQVIEGFSHDVVEDVAARTPQASLLFHDGAHTAEAYVRDFEAYLPLLEHGAVVLYDDIRWQDDRWRDGPAHTYEGWLQVTRHPAVRGAWEIDGELGLVQLT